MIGIFNDLRYGLRALAKSRLVSLVAVLSLALGIGANTTIFTLVSGILLAPLPVAEPSRLAAVFTTDPHNPGMLACSYPNYQDYRDRNTVFSSLALYSAVTINQTGRGDPQLRAGELVTGNYFATLGVNPIMGRGFLPEEDRSPGAYPVALISYGLWTGQFGRDPGILARTIELNGRAYRIVGVTPQAFHGLNQLWATDVWVPLMMYQQVYPNPGWVNQRRALIFAVVGRLKSGLNLAEAEAGIQTTVRDLEREYPKDNQGRRVKLVPVAEAAVVSKTRAVVTSAGTVLMIAAGLLLLTACGNVANLLLARATARRREITVRLALGAGRWHLVRQLLAESLVLSTVGGAAGLALAAWARQMLWSRRPPLFNHAAFRLDMDYRVLGFTFAISLLTGMVFGMVPALSATRTDLANDLKDRGGQPASTGRLWHPRSLLVSGQVAFSLVALIGAGLFIRSLRKAGEIDPGFDAPRLAAVSFNVGNQGYSEARGREYQRRALELAASTPGVVAAAVAKDVPLHVSAARTVLLDGQENTASGMGRFTLTEPVSPGYFRTMRIPLLAGRDFSPLDEPAAPRVAIVNEAAAAHFWPGQPAVGKRLHFYGDPLPAEVVGVARNANYQALGEQPQAFIYVSTLQYYFPTAVIYLNTAGDPEKVAASVRRAMQPLDRNLLLESESLGRSIRESLWAQRLSAGLLGVFGLLALLLATIGIYAVVSYSVNQRVREIGVRMALGATSGSVQRMVLREGLRVVAVGLAAGTLVALAVSRAVESMLFTIGGRDPVTFVLVPAVLALVALLACWIPARRTARFDPARSLRQE